MPKPIWGDGLGERPVWPARNDPWGYVEAGGSVLLAVVVGAIIAGVALGLIR